LKSAKDTDGRYGHKEVLLSGNNYGRKPEMRTASPDYVEISAKIFIDRFEAENDCKVQGVLFNKYMPSFTGISKRKDMISVSRIAGTDGEMR